MIRRKTVGYIIATYIIFNSSFSFAEEPNKVDNETIINNETEIMTELNVDINCDVNSSKINEQLEEPKSLTKESEIGELENYSEKDLESMLNEKNIKESIDITLIIMKELTLNSLIRI